jgi:hypothetical protein
VVNADVEDVSVIQVMRDMLANLRRNVIQNVMNVGYVIMENVSVWRVMMEKIAKLHWSMILKKICLQMI